MANALQNVARSCLWLCARWLQWHHSTSRKNTPPYWRYGSERKPSETTEICKIGTMPMLFAYPLFWLVFSTHTHNSLQTHSYRSVRRLTAAT